MSVSVSITIDCVHCQGRIHQLEYAMEAVKQGSAAVGIKSRTHAILVALKVHHLTTTATFTVNSGCYQLIVLL